MGRADAGLRVSRGPARRGPGTQDLSRGPAPYQGRATHIHLEVTINGVSRKVTQIAFPESVNNTVHAAGVYASRGTNPTTNAADGIFADSLSAELVTPTGSTASGYAAAFQVAIAL